MASVSHPPEQQFFDTFDDGEALDSLTRPASDYELLQRFPSFYLPGGSFSDGVAGSHPTGRASPDPSPTSVAGPLHSEHSQSKHSPRMQPFETSHKVRTLFPVCFPLFPHLATPIWRYGRDDGAVPICGDCCLRNPHFLSPLPS